MGRPYRNAREHLDDEIGLIAQLVERQIVAHWEAGVLPRIKDKFSGGYIRNAVLRAAFLAAAEDSSIDMKYLVRAANLEYAAMGKVITTLGEP